MGGANTASPPCAADPPSRASTCCNRRPRCGREDHPIAECVHSFRGAGRFDPGRAELVSKPEAQGV